MAKSTRPRTSQASTSKSNATSGYAKRQSRKEKIVDELEADVYEYKQDVVRRSKVSQDLGRDEAMEFGDESEEDPETRARLVGENGEDEKIDSADDEEIDSDGAFEESDEERYAGFSFKNKPAKKSALRKKPSVRFADVNLDEDNAMEGVESDAEDAESEESGDDEEFIDLLDILDGKGEVDQESDAAPAPRPRSDADMDVGSDEESSSGEEESENDESDLEDTPPEALDQLESFISGLDPGRKRKAPADDDGETKAEARTRKRRMLKERTEAGAENEFRAQASGSKLQLDDLLASLGSTSSNLLSLKKSTKSLAPGSSSTALAAPLPQRTQERLDREAAYEQTKEEVDKWKATMKRIKEAEHLSFPLQATPAGRTSNLELAAKFKPTTELESSIDKLLKSAKMREEDMAQTEDLKMNHLTVEEVAERRGELRKMRELMFRAEVKAKRVAKIKSKTYRRIKKKGREKAAAAGAEEEDEEDEGVRLKREVARARERATLRHKNTGKWAKSMKGRELDLDERREISAMLDRGEKLRKRIQGKGDDDEEEDDGESSDEEDDNEREGADVGDDGVMRIRASAFEELERINALDTELEADGDALGSKSKSVFAMKFMQDGIRRRQLETQVEEDDFRKEMGGGENLNSDREEVDVPEGEAGSGLAVQRTGGRVLYRPGVAPGSILARPMGSLASDTSSVTLRSTDLLAESPPPETISSRGSAAKKPIAGGSNPWLVPVDGSSKALRKKNEIIVNKDSASLEKSKNKMRKRGKKGEAEKARAKEDEVIEISMSNVMTLDDGGANSEVEEQEKALDPKGKGKWKGPNAFEQRDLVALAFAGDNVVQDFEAAKRREIAADAPRQVDTTLPGWGSWGGTGTRKQAPKPHLIKKIKGIDPTSRSDFNKSHVIISEKRDKKATKYMIKDLPYPYTSQAQFERSMDTPLGTEWNTRVAFQRATLPKVVKKMGTIIDPLEKMY